jgi:nucleoid DNA-binding protein
MTTSEIIKTLAKRLQMTQAEARRLFRAKFAALTASLQKGETARLRGFGAFSVTTRKPLRAYDAKSNSFVPLPAKREISFQPNKPLSAESKPGGQNE